jgi:uncharacterized protein YuzE
MGKLIVEDHPRFDEKTIENLTTTTAVYNSDEDTLFIRPETARPAVSYDLNGELWIRFDPATKEIIGLEIENFESVFLKKHPEIAKVWKTVKPHCAHKKTRIADDEICTSFLRILLSFFNELFRENPQQTGFSSV